jgi:hypothetical protein
MANWQRHGALTVPANTVAQQAAESYSERGSPWHSATALTSAVAYDNVVEEPGMPAGRPTRSGVFATTALSIFLSTASLFADPRTVLLVDPAATFARRRSTRRRISLVEAREIALDAVKRERTRFADAAELEGLYFTTLFGWKPE